MWTQRHTPTQPYTADSNRSDFIYSTATTAILDKSIHYAIHTSIPISIHASDSTNIHATIYALNATIRAKDSTKIHASVSSTISNLSTNHSTVLSHKSIHRIHTSQSAPPPSRAWRNSWRWVTMSLVMILQAIHNQYFPLTQSCLFSLQNTHSFYIYASSH